PPAPARNMASCIAIWVRRPPLHVPARRSARARGSARASAGTPTARPRPAPQREGKGGVAVLLFGDGGSIAGPFHEWLNIAATWKLPMLYVCENNMYAAGTAAAATHALPDVAARAAGYGIPGLVG